MRSNRTTDEEVRRLDEEVHRLRETVFELVPEKAQETLRGYTSCENRDAVWRWIKDAADKIIDLADRKPAQEMGEYLGTGERAYCPLCGGGARGPGPAEGFSWPEGLRRHLLGEYNSHQCGVMWAAQNAAIEASESEFSRRLREVPAGAKPHR